jgi:hypothetical protein
LKSLEEFLLQQIAPLWHRQPIGIGISIVAGLGAGYVAGRAFGAISFLLVLGFWYYSHYIPRIQHGKIGILVAIVADQEDESRQVETDFVANLRQLLQRDLGGSRFQIISMPEFASLSINEDVEQAMRYLHKARAHFMLYGRARKRTAEERTIHLLNLECAVRQPFPLPCCWIALEKMLNPEGMINCGIQQRNQHLRDVLARKFARFLFGKSVRVFGALSTTSALSFTASHALFRRSIYRLAV